MGLAVLRRLFVRLSIVSVALALAVAAPAADFVPRGAPVVVGSRGVRSKTMLRRVAGELAKALAQTSGAESRVLDESGAPTNGASAVYLGNTQAARAAGFDVAALPALGYRLVVTNGNAYLLARTAMAAAYAVHDFAAEKLDYSFVTFDGADPHSVDPARTVAPCDVTGRPAIGYRKTYSPDKSRTLGAARKDLPLRLLLMKADVIEEELDAEDRLSTQMHSCHSQFDYLPPETHFEAHPEYYALGKDGKRHGRRNRDSHPCFTHPEVERIVWSNLVSFIRADRAAHPKDPPLVYDFTQMDAAPNFCQCPACAAEAAKYDAAGGRTAGGDAGLQLAFVNRLARRLKAEYPGVKLRIFAYVSTEVAPARGIVPEDNVIVWLCDLYTTSVHEVPLAHPANAARAAIFRAWAAKARRMEIWDYMLYGDQSYLMGGHGDFPEVNVDAVVADARLFRESGVERIFMEAEYRDQPFHELNVAAMGAAWWNPDVSADRIVADYCRVYGRAAETMRKGIALVRELQLGQDAQTTRHLRWHRRDLSWLTVENMTRIRDLFAAADRLADTPAARRRTAHALRSAERKLALLRKAATGDLEYVFSVTNFNFSNKAVRKDGAVVYPAAEKSVPMGVYDWETKGTAPLRLAPLAETASEFAWHPIGTADVPRAGTLWLDGRWSATVDLRVCHAQADGLPEDYNRFDFFVHACRKGECLQIDRVRLVRKVGK